MRIKEIKNIKKRILMREKTKMEDRIKEVIKTITKTIKLLIKIATIIKKRNKFLRKRKQMKMVLQ